jgi:hypothetical protein
MFLMLPAPPGLDSQNPTILYVYGGLKVGVTPAFPGRGRGRCGCDHHPRSLEVPGVPQKSTAPNAGRSIKKGNETVQATIWGMSSPATSVKRMFRPL